MSKILIYAGSCASLNYSFIAPVRIARACHRHGNEVKMIDWADTRLKNIIKIGQKFHKWGECFTLSEVEMINKLKQLINTWKPDIVYSMGTTHSQKLVEICNGYNIPLGVHVGDPYYAAYPSSSALDFYEKVKFLTFNEGQAWNYIKTKYSKMGDKCYLLNHAIDPELSPTLEEVQKTEKKYICSIVGGDDRIRRRELILYYYQWTDKFPNNKFATGGSLTKGANSPYTREDLCPSIKDNTTWNHTTFNEAEVEKFQNKKFNLEYVQPDLQYPLGLSHKAVHKLYSESMYGFCPFGYYLREGWQSEFNVMTFGTKTLEMGGSGAAMICNSIKDIDVIIKQGETGFIFNKPEDCYTAFKLAIDKPEEVKQIGINAYKFIHKYHSWDNRYLEVLEPIFKKLGVK